MSPQGRAPELSTQLDELQALLDGLGLVYNTKRDALRNSVNSNNAGEGDAATELGAASMCRVAKTRFRI